MSYLKRKNEFLKDKVVNPDIKLGMETAEKLMEEEVREIVAPYAQLIQKLNKLVDTKKPETREEIMKWLLENPGTMKKLTGNVDKLINISRV
jgi:flagellar biosynthesis/type III secretory pathway protein FliH